MELQDLMVRVLPEGIGLYEFKLRRIGGGYQLELSLDGLKRPDGSVTLEECETVSRGLSTFLDEILEKGTEEKSVLPENFKAENYTVEVSSAGAERKLRSEEEYQRFRGRPLKVKFDLDGVRDSALCVYEGKEGPDFLFKEYIPARKRKTVRGGRMYRLKAGEILQVNLYLDF